MNDDVSEYQSHSKFVENWKTQMSVAYQTTLKNSNQSKENDIERYDITKKFSLVLDNGDRVPVRNISKRGGTGKISF